MDSPTDVAATNPNKPTSLAEFTRLLYEDPPQSTTSTIEQTVAGIREDRDAAKD